MARRPASASAPDRATVILLSLAAVLVVLALLATQLRNSGAKAATRPAVVVRKVYQTTVVTTVRGQGAGTSVSQSVSSSGSGYSGSSLPTTRSSHS